MRGQRRCGLLGTDQVRDVDRVEGDVLQGLDQLLRLDAATLAQVRPGGSRVEEALGVGGRLGVADEQQAHSDRLGEP